MLINRVNGKCQFKIFAALAMILTSGIAWAQCDWLDITLGNEYGVEGIDDVFWRTRFSDARTDFEMPGNLLNPGDEEELTKDHFGLWAFWANGKSYLSVLTVEAAEPDLPENESKESGKVFQERYRPQFHYTTAKGWINDPVGLVYYKGEYHLFNDHNPFSRQFPGGLTNGEQSHWSHAISTDLVYWKHMPIAVYPDENGAC